MMDEEQVVESSGADVTAAIAAGLAQLGIDRDAVEVDVLDEGARGVFGLGSREARVRLSAKKEGVEVLETEEYAPTPTPTMPVDDSAGRTKPEEDDDEALEAQLGRDTLLELLSLMGISDIQVERF